MKDIDLHSVSKEELWKLDLADHKKFFGPVGDAETAAEVVAIVHSKVYKEYENCDKFIVGYNKVAGV